MTMLDVRNGINHLLLNGMLRLRYLARRHRGFIACLIGVEALCVRTGIIFYGHSHARPGMPSGRL
jgi:hypothetical protein